jgi:hypothetical protein
MTFAFMLLLVSILSASVVSSPGESVDELNGKIAEVTKQIKCHVCKVRFFLYLNLKF